MATPDYILIDEVSIRRSAASEPIILPQGAFVRPLEYTYLPAHIKNDSTWKTYPTTMYTFAYTRYGILPIKTTNIRKV